MRKTLLTLALVLLATTVTAQSSSNVQLEVQKTEPIPLQSSEYGTVWVEATNTGGADTDVEVTFDENYPFEVVRGNRNSWDLGTLSPGEEYVMRLEVRVDENAVQGNNSLDFTVTTPSLTYTQSLDIEVRADNNILSVADVEFPEHIGPGTSEEMTLTLENMADAQLKNVQASLDIPGDTPVVATGASTKSLEKIDASGTAEITYQLSADETAQNGVYTLPLTLEYENEAGTEFERETDIGIVVGGVPQLETGINSENQLSPGTTDTVTFRIVNQGEGRARFTEMTVKDTENIRVLSPPTTYIGDMDPDDFQTAEYQVHVSGEPGQLSIPVELEYRTENGTRTETQEVQATVYSSGELRSLGLTQGGSLLPVIVVLLAVVGGAYYWRRRKRNE